MNRLERAIFNLAMRLFESSARELEGAGRPKLARLVRGHRRRVERREKPKSLAGGAGGRVLAGRVLSRSDNDDEHQA